MPISISAIGSQKQVLRGILSGLEAKSRELLVPRLLQPTPNAPARGLIKTIKAGHMGDGDSVDAFKVAPGGTIPKADPLSFGEVEYRCAYRKLYDLVPKEEVRADEDLPASVVDFRARNLMGTLLRNRDRVLVNSLENTAWGQVTDLSAGGGANQFDKADSDPIKVLADLADAQPMQPNVLIFGAQAWHQFRLNAQVLSAMKITEHRAMMKQDDWAQLIGEHLGISQIIVYNMRVHTGGPMQEVSTGTLIRRFAKKVWMGTIDGMPSPVTTNARGENEILTNPTALKYIVEDELDYDEAPSINPQGRQMTVAMSYDIRPVTAALGARLDAVVS